MPSRSRFALRISSYGAVERGGANFSAPMRTDSAEFRIRARHSVRMQVRRQGPVVCRARAAMGESMSTRAARAASCVVTVARFKPGRPHLARIREDAGAEAARAGRSHRASCERTGRAVARADRRHGLAQRPFLERGSVRVLRKRGMAARATGKRMPGIACRAAVRFLARVAR